MDFGSMLAAANPVAMIANVAGGIGNALSQGKTNQAQEDIANNQMNFQREMSDTAHQREVKDLRKAGLNPYLTSTGQGSSTPSGASANFQAPQINLPDMMAYGVSLKQLEQAQQTIDNAKAGTANETRRVEIEALNSLSEREYKKWQTFNERYGMQGATSRFFKDLYNEDKSGVSLNKIGELLKNSLMNLQKPKIGIDKNRQTLR